MSLSTINLSASIQSGLLLQRKIPSIHIKNTNIQRRKNTTHHHKKTEKKPINRSNQRQCAPTPASETRLTPQSFELDRTRRALQINGSSPAVKPALVLPLSKSQGQHSTPLPTPSTRPSWAQQDAPPLRRLQICYYTITIKPSQNTRFSWYLRPSPSPTPIPPPQKNPKKPNNQTPKFHHPKSPFSNPINHPTNTTSHHLTSLHLITPSNTPT
ncbi:hypothetical protein KC19_6G185700 [Ceratodon purpureus]|uniref:Uncharacterized protein n=1 Tax=Ceratodon purpureus TaxID=3225 RepID=A0A8T0HG73_CERPU|nr:hypothetical protein KC19_6G185700 [Ceratodon purpureus]